jgi:hypothetical protein
VRGWYVVFVVACGTDGVDKVRVESACQDLVDEDADGLTDCDDDECWEDPSCYAVDDPVDLLPPDGHPSVDIDKVGISYVDGVATCFATMEGAWPPPFSIEYEASCAFLNDAELSIARVFLVHEREQGFIRVVTSGLSDSNEVTVRHGDTGIFIRITAVVLEVPTKFAFQTAMRVSTTSDQAIDLARGAIPE